MHVHATVARHRERAALLGANRSIALDRIRAAQERRMIGTAGAPGAGAVCFPYVTPHARAVAGEDME